MSNFDSMGYDVVGMRLPNGKVKVVSNKNGSVGEVFENADAFNRKFSAINESTGTQLSVTILDMING